MARRKALCALFPGQAALPLPGSLSPFRAVSGEGPVDEKKAGTKPGRFPAPGPSPLKKGYAVPAHANRKVSYAGRKDLEESILRQRMRSMGPTGAASGKDTAAMNAPAPKRLQILLLVPD